MMKRYPAYKDSGMPWLGEMPAHWSVRRVKYFWKELQSKSLDGSETLLSVSQYTGVTPREEGKTRAESLEGYRTVRRGDLVINIMLAWLGALAVSDYDGIVSPAYCVYRVSPEHNPKYFGYLFQTDAYLAEFARRSRGVVESRWRMYTEDFFRVVSIVPSRPEQRAIVAFLDRKLAEIDRYIADKQKLIALLQEQKTALINRAVTRGLNPNVKMKPSGVEWLGEVPEHWTLTKLSRVCSSIRDGTHAPPLAVPGIHRLLSARNIVNGDFVIRDDDRTMSPDDFVALQKSFTVGRGDVVVAIVGATTGKSAIVGDIENVSVQRSLAILRPNLDKMKSEFLNFCLMSSLVQNQIQIIMEKYAAQPGIYLDELASLRIPLVDLGEQAKIISYIQSEKALIDNAISKAQHEIELIAEYRTALIAEVVTGKMDVRGERGSPRERLVK